MDLKLIEINSQEDPLQAMAQMTGKNDVFMTPNWWMLSRLSQDDGVGTVHGSRGGEGEQFKQHTHAVKQCHPLFSS